MVIVTGFFSLMYVPSKLIVWENPALTFHNISSETQLFRLGIASSIICYIAFTSFGAISLKNVDETCAKLMVILALISIPISFINLQSKFSVLTIVEGAGYLKIIRNSCRLRSC
jgi:hypothetical protein